MFRKLDEKMDWRIIAVTGAITVVALHAAGVLLRAGDAQADPGILSSHVRIRPEFATLAIQEETSRIDLNTIPELTKKVIQSKLEKITQSRYAFVELFSPDSSEEDTDAIVVLLFALHHADSSLGPTERPE